MYVCMYVCINGLLLNVIAMEVFHTIKGRDKKGQEKQKIKYVT